MGTGGAMEMGAVMQTVTVRAVTGIVPERTAIAMGMVTVLCAGCEKGVIIREVLVTAAHH